MIIGFGNNVVSSLAADITAGQTTIQVMPGAGAIFAGLLSQDFTNSSNTPKIYAKITLTDAKETVFEICHLTAVNDDVLTVVRAQEGTTAKGWSLNDVIANFATRGSENQFVQIEELQSGHYTSGVAGGTANALTIALPATYFVNSSTDWTLRTPLVIYPSLNNTGAATLQLTMGGRVLGTFPLYKGNKAQLTANDILKDVALVCLMDKTKTFFSVANPGAIYAGLGTAAFRDVTTSASDTTAGRVLKVGDGGVLGETLSATDANLLTRDGLASMLFKQGGGNGTSHFGGYGVGAHLLYGLGSNSQVLSGNLFIDSSGNLSVEWLAVSKTDGSIVTQRKQKMVPDVRKVNGHSLANDANVTAQDIFNGQTVQIPNAADLNSFTTPGLYFQPANAQASTGKNYPEAVAGSLEVLKHAGISQIFRTYNNSRSYIRTLYSNVWTAWTKQYDAANKPTAGDVGAYTKAEGDARYQAKGDYTPTGTAYTKAESNARYVQGVQLGARSLSASSNGSGGNLYLPAGCVATGYTSPGSSNANDVKFYYKPIQRNVNGTWVTISG